MQVCKQSHLFVPHTKEMEHFISRTWSRLSVFFFGFIFPMVVEQSSLLINVCMQHHLNWRISDKAPTQNRALELVIDCSRFPQRKGTVPSSIPSCEHRFSLSPKLENSGWLRYEAAPDERLLFQNDNATPRHTARAFYDKNKTCGLKVGHSTAFSAAIGGRRTSWLPFSFVRKK